MNCHISRDYLSSNADGGASEVRSNDTYGLFVIDCASVVAVELFEHNNKQLLGTLVDGLAGIFGCLVCLVG